jgi:site-specific recombinase XerD
LRGIAELRSITRVHVIAWRKDLEKRVLAASSIRRKRSATRALSLFSYSINVLASSNADMPPAT